MSEQRFTAVSETANVATEDVAEAGFGGEVFGGSLPPEVAIKATWNPTEQAKALEALKHHYYVVRKAIVDSENV